MKTAQSPFRTDRGSHTGALRTFWLRVGRSGDKPRAMRYISTRGNAPVLNFEEDTLAGLASDGGLYLPESWPTLSTEVLRSLRTASYVETAVARSEEHTTELQSLMRRSYAVCSLDKKTHITGHTQQTKHNKTHTNRP